jgi:hypothetical protein
MHIKGALAVAFNGSKIPGRIRKSPSPFCESGNRFLDSISVSRLYVIRPAILGDIIAVAVILTVIGSKDIRLTVRR